jgi:hypothetical protein
LIKKKKKTNIRLKLPRKIQKKMGVAEIFPHRNTIALRSKNSDM